MSLDDLRSEWRQEMESAVPPGEISQLLKVAQERCTSMEQVVHGRDLREVLASALVVGLFAAALPIHRKSPAAVLGIGVIILGAAIIIYRLLSAGKPQTVRFEASVLDFARSRLAWIDRQIHLLKTVLWWYVAPICGGVLLFAWGVTGGEWIAFGVQVVVVLLVAAGIVALNKHALRTQLQPIREDLIRLIAALEGVDASKPRE